MLELPDPITGFFRNRLLGHYMAVLCHVGIRTVSVFLIATGGTANAWYFQVHDMRIAAFLGISNGLIAAGTAMWATWSLNLPKGLKMPPEVPPVQPVPSPPSIR